jgi:hypothetical protein
MKKAPGCLPTLLLLVLMTVEGRAQSVFDRFDSNASSAVRDVTLTIIPTPTPATVIISGAISYCFGNPTPGPVPNVTLVLTGSGSASTLSDSSGNYQFIVPSGGSYIVTPSKADIHFGTNPGISSVDVVAAQRQFLGLGIPLTGCRLTAADVNGNGAVGTSDVVAIQRYVLWFATGTSNVGKYQFAPTNHTYSGIVTDQTLQNFDALVFGDAAGATVDRPEGPELDDPDLNAPIGMLGR